MIHGPAGLCLCRLCGRCCLEMSDSSNCWMQPQERPCTGVGHDSMQGGGSRPSPLGGFGAPVSLSDLLRFPLLSRSYNVLLQSLLVAWRVRAETGSWSVAVARPTQSGDAAAVRKSFGSRQVFKEQSCVGLVSCRSASGVLRLMSILIALAVDEDVHSSPDHRWFIPCVTSMPDKVSKGDKWEGR